MGLFQAIGAEARTGGCDFLIIGGLAVNFHGVSRDTADLDLLIRAKDRAAWSGILERLGYRILRDGAVFVQLAPGAFGAWPVDLMIVKDATFDSMLAAGREVEMYGSQVRIPCLEHLLALKLHALKNSNPGRYMKDLLDVEALVRVNALDLNSERIRHLFLKYGTMRLYEQVSRFNAGEQPGA
jgi:predicted nucleotidyltransferase